MARLLLIDDDKDDREIFSEAVLAAGPGTRLYCFAEVQEAFRQLDNGEVPLPDLIFLDINLPVVSGWQCLTKLKSHSAYRDIPVIMYSTSSYSRDKDIAKDLGALCFLTKPQEYKVLISILKTVLDHLHSSSLSSVCKAISA